jgi:CRP-like cAMP-binding protein
MQVAAQGKVERALAREWSLLATLSEAEQERFLTQTRRRSYDRGEILVHEGDPSDCLHLVESGRLAVRVDTIDGDTAMLNVIQPGDWFGELSLLGDENAVRTATVLALEPSTTRTLTSTAFSELRRQHPAVGELLLTLMARRIGDLSNRLVEVMYVSLDRRVCRRLVELCDTYADHPTTTSVTVPLTQEQLAGLVGGTRSSVNEVLQGLAKQGIVELGRGRIVVHHPGELAGKAG